MQRSQQDKLHYVKRYQMVYNLVAQPVYETELPPNFVWIPWHPRFVDDHARMVYLGFRGELDSLIFPTFRRFDSCLRLMRQVCGNAKFLPKSCWLVAQVVSGGGFEYYATIQGLRGSTHIGEIQNLAVLASARRRGLAEAVLRRSLCGFLESGCQKVTLEVTAENRPALQLYRKVGFDIFQTIYKETWLD
ncbi:MAG: N-acetyltransferase [Planctomycetia bacterium]|nr:N-acetyltransferase [Planctomycetia bacterium]